MSISVCHSEFCLSFRAKRGILVSPGTQKTISAHVSAPPTARHHPAQKNVAHLPRDLLLVGINPRVVPRVDPIHHAEQAEYRYPRGELQPPLALQLVKQTYMGAGR